MNNLKQRIKNGEAVHGCWLNTGSPLTAEIVGGAEFDWVLIDLEHGAGSESTLLPVLQALGNTKVTPIVRIESPDGPRIHRVLDMGASGVMCPKISTPDDALRLARGLHYPPFGTRGVAKMVRATGFGRNFQNYYDQSRDNIIGIAQIETVAVLDHLDEVAQTEGIDVLFIGPADLSMELGIIGQFDHPRFVKAMTETIAAAQKAGKAVGILFFNADDYSRYYNLGIRFLACGSDATFVAEGAHRLSGQLSQFRQSLNS